MDWIPAVLTIITAATPLLYAALGELITEKSGILNLGVEGMMLIGAVMAFAITHWTGNAFLGVLGGMAAGMLLASGFALLVLVFQASQVPTGLALTLFSIGLSALIGHSLVGIAYDGLPKISIPGLASLPGVGELFHQDALVYLSLILTALTARFLYRTRAGLALRAIGDSHDAAHAMGYSVLKVRASAIITGGAMSGLGGAYLSLSYSPLWVENMTSGRGWIALALVVFASWKVGRLLLGAYLFGAISILQLHAQALGIGVPSQIMSMLPYLATILVLIVISRSKQASKISAPASLGVPFRADH